MADGTIATLDEAFEKEVVARAMKDATFCREAVSVLESHRIANKHVSWAWGVVRETWLSLSELANVAILTARARRDFPDETVRVAHLRVVRALWTMPGATARASLEEVRRFAKMAHLHDAAVVMAKKLAESDPDGAEEEIRKALRTAPRSRDYEVCRWMAEFEARQAARRYAAEHPEDMPVIATGLSRKLDKLVRLRRGHFASVTATTAKGKSIALMNIGFQAAARGFRVCHVTTEMSAEEQADRYDSRFTVVEYEKFKAWSFTDEELRRISGRVESWRERMLDRLRICAVPCRRADTAQVRQIVADMADEMGGCDVVIVDSYDHMVSTLRHREIRLDQAEVYWEAKALGQEGYDGDGASDPSKRLLVWTSTQAGKEWAELIATAESGSESYDKGRILDLMLTLNAPGRGRRKKRGGAIVEEDAEAESDSGEERLPKLDGYLAKWRHGRSRVRIPFDADFARMWIREGVDDEMTDGTTEET